jgi:hypothetical protein
MSRPSNRLGVLISIACLLIAGVASPVGAQSTDRSGLEGKVADQSGAVLPGVTVTISSPALQSPQLVMVTDGEGHYRFAALPAGTYTASYELTGFQTVKREGLGLSVGFVAVVNVTLTVGSVTETLTVTGQSPVVDVRTTAVSTNFSKEALETVPTSRTMWQVMTLSPGVRVSGTPDVGGSQTGQQSTYINYGSNGGGNRATIEGVDTEGPVGCAGIYADYGAFAEIQIKPMGNDAEMPKPGTNFVGVIKSGGNEFHGGGLYQWEGPSLESNNIDAALQANGVTSGNPLASYFDSNVDFGGRIVRDRLWFYGAAHRQEIQTAVIGYPANNIVKMKNYSGKITAQLTPKQRLIWFDQYNDKDWPDRGANALTPPVATIHQVYTPNVAKGEWTYTPSSADLVNLLVGHADWDSNYDPPVPGSGPSTFDNVSLLNGGTSLLNNASHSTRARWQVSGSYSHFTPSFLGGEHNFKAGFEIQKDLYQRLIQDRGSDGNYQEIFSNGSPFEIITYNNPFTSINQASGQSGFVTDSWRLSQRLTLNLGVRAERYYVYLPAQSKPVGTFSVAADYPAQDIQDWRGVVPRIGVSYAMTSDLRTVFKATYGRFNWPGLAETGLTYNKNNLVTTTYRWNVTGCAESTGCAFNPSQLGAFVSVAGGVSTVLNSALRQPKTDEWTATIERELMRNFSARLSYVYKRELDQYQLVNTARPYSAYDIPVATVDPATGSPLTIYDYDPAYKGAAFVVNENLNTPGYTNSYNNIEVVANKRLSNRWQLLATYLATHRNVWIATGVSPYLGVPQDPDAANFYPKDQTWQRVFKVSGSYLLPYDIQLASSFSALSGQPFARTAVFSKGLSQLGSIVLNMEPIGTESYPAQNLLAFRVEKRQKLPIGVATFQFDVFNALNTNAATSETTQSGPNFGKILAIVPPRIARLGVTFTF